MATQKYGHLIVPTPVVNASGGDYTAVADTTQAQYPLGSIYIFADSSQRPRIIKYVQYNPTSAATWTEGAPLYYIDNTRTVVTNVVTEAETYVASSFAAIGSFAGIGLNASDPTDGKFIFIQTGGFCDRVLCPASTATGDQLVLTNTAATAPTNNTWVRVAAATTLTVVESAHSRVILTDVGAAGGGLGSGWVQTPCLPV